MANPTHEVQPGKSINIGKIGGLARINATLAGKPSDRVPFIGPQCHDHCMIVANVPARKYYWDAELMADVMIAVQRWYGFDVPTILYDIYNVEAEALGAKMIYSDNAMPTVDSNDPLIKTVSDLERIGSLNPIKGRVSLAVEIAQQAMKKSPGPFAVGAFCSPFSFLCQVMGYPKAVKAIRRDKAFAQDLFDYTENQVLFPFLKAFTDGGVNKAHGADAWAAFPNLTPELVEEWILPSSQRLKEKARVELDLDANIGGGAAEYCEEDPDKFEKDIMFKCWETALKIEPGMILGYMGRTQDWNMHWLQEFAVKHGEKGLKKPIFIAINGRFIRDRSPGEIIGLVRDWIDILGRDGGLMMTIGNVPADTNPRNIFTAIKAVHELGTYPIVLDLDALQIGAPSYRPFDEWLKGQPEERIILKAREWKSSNKKVYI